ncbi:ABC transporter ATP-binding protein [Bradyrhizobium sp. 33ap4]|uniref:ABC transporter ATP-binding protein n=1 Tax=Bradyrhizobium sp. 33ap4 TaxID=3061630 RepID=UPI00292FE98C|nr:ABC transporter ATP-binding protein [Bradyrhizobium sp. 33ap4]
MSLETSERESLLSISDLSLRFGGILALDGVSFDVDQGQICGVIGPNGAGKSSLFNCICRLYEPERGRIVFDKACLLTSPAHEIASLGIGRTFQHVASFKTMSVAQNIMVGAYHRSLAGFLGSALGLARVARDEARMHRMASELAAFVGLENMVESNVAHLPFAYQKRVEFARALASKPKLLLLDEPAAGLNHEELESLASLILKARDLLGLTVLLVEHHMGLVMGLSDKIVVLNFGRKIAEGSPGEVKNNAEVLRAYLGGRKR